MSKDIQDFEIRFSQKAVLCLYCRRSTQLTMEAEKRQTQHPDDYHFSIIRCHHCGKEALYLPNEVIDLEAA